MFYVYILKCFDGSYYVGQTDNLIKRIVEHNSGEMGGYTAERLPVVMVYHASFTTRDDALKTEAQIKGWSRAKKEALITGNIETLKDSAKKIHFT